jgi:hypothetical protein
MSNILTCITLQNIYTGLVFNPSVEYTLWKTVLKFRSQPTLCLNVVTAYISTGLVSHGEGPELMTCMYVCTCEVANMILVTYDSYVHVRSSAIQGSYTCLR